MKEKFGDIIESPLNTTLANKILVIGDGHIIEQGLYFDLLKQNGEYARLFNLQASTLN